jgi:hypothetical protein
MSNAIYKLTIIDLKGSDAGAKTLRITGILDISHWPVIEVNSF